MRSNKNPINDQYKIAPALKAALAELELSGTLEIEKPALVLKSTIPGKPKLPTYKPFFHKKNGRIIANDFDNVRSALGALQILYSRFYDTIDFDGREISLWKSESLNRLWFAIEKYFGFRPTKRFLVDVIREVREQVFDDADRKAAKS